jgi:hypothetical protein
MAAEASLPDVTAESGPDDQFLSGITWPSDLAKHEGRTFNLHVTVRGGHCMVDFGDESSAIREARVLLPELTVEGPYGKLSFTKILWPSCLELFEYTQTARLMESSLVRINAFGTERLPELCNALNQLITCFNELYDCSDYCGGYLDELGELSEIAVTQVVMRVIELIPTSAIATVVWPRICDYPAHILYNDKPITLEDFEKVNKYLKVLRLILIGKQETISAPDMVKILNTIQSDLPSSHYFSWICSQVVRR